MATILQSKVRLLRSFKGRVPLQVDDAPGKVHRVPFRLSNRKIVLQGRVNRVPVEFVLDTGSERTGLSDVTARRAGVASITATLTAGVGVAALRRLELGRADSIEVGTMRIRNVPVAIRTVVRGALPRWQSESFSPLSLGYSAVVDYQKREVLLARTLPEGQADFMLPMRMNRLPMVRGLLNSNASGVLRRRHRRRADLDQRGNGAVAGDAAGAQDSAARVRDVGRGRERLPAAGRESRFRGDRIPERRARRAEPARAEHPARLPARRHRRPPVPVGLSCRA